MPSSKRRKIVQSLCKKIQGTRLFSDSQKVDLLVALEEASEADKQKLEAGIDAFEREYERSVKQHSAQIQSIIGHAVKDMTEDERKKNQDAMDEIKLGLAFLAS